MASQSAQLGLELTYIAIWTLAIQKCVVNHLHIFCQDVSPNS